MSSLTPGLTRTQEFIVTPAHGITLGQDQPITVLSTPMMIWELEDVCRNLLLAHLARGEDSAGVVVHVRHLAATPVGMRVRTRATLVALEGRRCTFAVEAHDEKEKVGEGTHERIVIDVARFTARVTAKGGRED